MGALDVIIPCFNAQASIAGAIESALAQPRAGHIWVVDDASTDQSAALVETVASQHPGRISLIRLPVNRGAAHARNIAAQRSDKDIIAFLDADDAYEPQALEAAWFSLTTYPNLALVRLRLRPCGMPDDYASHPAFARAWRTMEMTVAGNLVIRRPLLLACGGFPEAALFRRLGGEDAALGNALHNTLQFGTLFDAPGVNYRFRPGAHADRLMRLCLFDEAPAEVTPQDRAESSAIRQSIEARIQALRHLLTQSPPGAAALTVEWGEG